MTRPTALVHIGCDAVAAAVSEVLREQEWQVLDDLDDLRDGTPLDALVYDPGFVCHTDQHDHRPAAHEPAQELHRLVTALRPAFAGGASVIALSTRESLGAPSDPVRSGAAAAVVATVRSLALAHAAAGVTVNTVVGLEKSANGLLPVTLRDVASSVAFFADRQSRYITGQTLYVCGGLNLVSSLSA